MASKILSPCATSASRMLASTSRVPSRSFQTSRTLLEQAAVAPAVTRPVVVPAVKKPVGAFRGGLFGFLLGSSLAGATVYYYILEEYKVSNQLLSEDIYALQSAVQRTHSYVTELENTLAQQGNRN